MRLASIKLQGEEIVAIVTKEGLIPVRAINDGQNFSDNLFALITSEQLDELQEWWLTDGLDRKSVV